eukprot:TRINITY_DN4653_c0_g1_i1.p1 TRINITY_DN4653_c0_g1~~TRINITY_DN4653_c0_g1_i1.p1  ORF type:complete len:270 (+),score=49.98 TRINITY_DN4653_c0_g1_i1:2025-2834(+)
MLSTLLEMTKGAKLSNELMYLYKEAYSSFIELLKSYSKKEEVAGSLISLFEDQWTSFKQYTKARSKNQAKILTNAGTLFDRYEDAKVRVAELLVLPSTVEDTMRSYICTFYLMKETLAILEGREIDEVSPFKDKRVVIPSDTFYFTGNYKVINCQELTDSEKCEQKSRFIVKDDRMFILLEPNYEKIEEPRIVFTSTMASIRVSTDFNDLKKITVYIRNLEEKSEKVLFFDSNMMVSYVKNWIEQAAANSLKDQFQAVDHYLNSCKPLK